MIDAIQPYVNTIAAGRISCNEDDEDDLVRHVGNAGKCLLKRVDPQTGQQLWILGKLRPDRKFDLGMEGVLSWRARMDVLGKLLRKKLFEMESQWLNAFLISRPDTRPPTRR